MQVSSIVPKAVGASVSDGERSFVQSTSAEPAPVKNPVQTAVPSTVATKANVEDNNSINTKAPSPEQMNKALEKVNDAFVQKSQNLLATIEKDKETGINVLKVTDKETKEVVRQFPAESVIAMAAVINQSLDAKGQLINVEA
jgi:flagellar protein FlaG